MAYTQTNAVAPAVQQASQASLGGKGGGSSASMGNSAPNHGMGQMFGTLGNGDGTSSTQTGTPNLASMGIFKAFQQAQAQANNNTSSEYTYTPAPIQQSPNQQTMDYSNPSTQYYVPPAQPQAQQQPPSQGWNSSSFMQGLRSLGLKGYQ